MVLWILPGMLRRALFMSASWRRRSPCVKACPKTPEVPAKPGIMFSPGKPGRCEDILSCFNLDWPFDFVNSSHASQQDQRYHLLTFCNVINNSTQVQINSSNNVVCGSCFNNVKYWRVRGLNTYTLSRSERSNIRNLEKQNKTKMKKTQYSLQALNKQ